MSTLLFFRGFNTYSDDNLRFGPINFGLAHQHLEPKFAQSGFQFIAIPDVGRGSPEDQISRAHKYISELSSLKINNQNLHLLGHSAGGLIARGLAHQIEKNPIANFKLRSVTTIASPHRGARTAEVIFNSQIHSPYFKKLLNSKIYNLDKKRSAFLPWTPANISTFNAHYPDLPNVRYASIVTGAHVRKLPFLLRLIHNTAHDEHAVSDGLVEIESQSWGEVLGRYELDHGAILGVRTTFLPKKHHYNQKKFAEMVDKIIAHIHSVEYT